MLCHSTGGINHRDMQLENNAISALRVTTSEPINTKLKEYMINLGYIQFATLQFMTYNRDPKLILVTWYQNKYKKIDSINLVNTEVYYNRPLKLLSGKQVIINSRIFIGLEQ